MKKCKIFINNKEYIIYDYCGVGAVALSYYIKGLIAGFNYDPEDKLFEEMDEEFKVTYLYENFLNEFNGKIDIAPKDDEMPIDLKISI